MKILKYGFLAAATFIVIAIIFAASQLPSPRQIERALVQPLVAPSSKKVLSQAQSESSSQAAQARSTASASEEHPTDLLQRRGQSLLRKLLNRPPTELHVCDNLDRATEFRPPQGVEEALAEALGNGSEANPYIESLQAPISFMIHRPAVKNVLEEALTLPADGDHSLFEKIGFYGRLAAATADLATNRNEFEMISDRSYHLYVLSRLAGLRPDILSNPLTREFCESVQRNLTDTDELSFVDERQALLELIQEAKVKPEDIDFDPQARTQIGISTDKNQLRIGIGQTKTPET